MMDSLNVPNKGNASGGVNTGNDSITTTAIGGGVGGSGGSSSGNGGSGGSSTPTDTVKALNVGGNNSNTSITVRFNASDECVESIYSSFQNNGSSNLLPTNTVGGGGGGGGGNGNSAGGRISASSSNNGSTNTLATIGLSAANNNNGANNGTTAPGVLIAGDGLTTNNIIAQQQQQQQSSPLVLTDEQTNRNNFLPSNFFNRKSGLSPRHSTPLSPNHLACQIDNNSGGPLSPSALSGSGGGSGTGSINDGLGSLASGSGGGYIGAGGIGSPYNGSQSGLNRGCSSGGISPNTIMNSGDLSPSGGRCNRSLSFPDKGGSSPIHGFSLDVPTLGSLGNGNKSPVSNDPGASSPSSSYMGVNAAAAAAAAAAYLGNGLDMRPLDHCLNDIMQNMGVVGGPCNDNGALMVDRLRAPPKLSEHHLGEVDALTLAGGNGASGFLDSGLKLNSPSSGGSPHSPCADTARYSRKVFVGGLPPDIDEDEITQSFRRFGPLVVDWPHKAESKSYFPPKGYAFLLFQDENSVQNLIDACIIDEDKLYLCVSSPTIKDKPVQIRPWRLNDADYVLDATMSLDPRKTVFVGGVPRPLKAYELAMIMNRLYGGVCYAGIDTDPELKYPKGAGRVAFSNQQSYISAISARFVQLQHGDIDKRVEVKPYVLDDQMCDECEGQRCCGKFAPYFCANVTCLQYYCEHCWAIIHSRPGREYHKPLVKEGADRPRAVPFRWC